MKKSTQRPKGKGGLHTREQMICSMKVPHASARVAERAAVEGMERNGIPLYVYRCAQCKRWHLTKRLQRGR